MTDYIFATKMLKYSDLILKLKRFGVHEEKNEETNPTAKCLTDGYNYMWIYLNKRGRPISMAHFGANDPTDILLAVEAASGVNIVSEYDDEYEEFFKD
jgi:hypothetical protein